MQISILSVGAVGLALLSLAPEGAPAEGPEGLVGRTLWATEAPVDPWEAPRAEDLPLEDLGTVAAVVEGTPDAPGHLVVAVGGLWGWGAKEVEVGLDRLHLLRAEEGDALVVDLSVDGAAPVEG